MPLNDNKGGFSFKFFLNEFAEFSESSGMVTRGVTHLAELTFPAMAIGSIFPLIPLGRYVLPLTSLKRYLPSGSDDNWEFLIPKLSL